MQIKKIGTIDDYIQTLDVTRQQLAYKIKDLLLMHFPHAMQTIAYQVPTFKVKLYKKISKSKQPKLLNCIHFALFQNHLSLFPTSQPIEFFKSRLQDYVTSKGTVQFTFNKPIPFDLITEIADYRKKQIIKEYGDEYLIEF